MLSSDWLINPNSILSLARWRATTLADSTGPWRVRNGRQPPSSQPPSTPALSSASGSSSTSSSGANTPGMRKNTFRKQSDSVAQRCHPFPHHPWRGGNVVWNLPSSRVPGLFLWLQKTTLRASSENQSDTKTSTNTGTSFVKWRSNKRKVKCKKSRTRLHVI